ncbi:hypothetical protein H9P43_004561 [Blastocladiella emersonii ATCC 22665]|nr:hypothetical protein H9P43_004561 [Blastocladiella emersonii ATCC 22665]
MPPPSPTATSTLLLATFTALAQSQADSAPAPVPPPPPPPAPPERSTGWDKSALITSLVVATALVAICAYVGCCRRRRQKRAKDDASLPRGLGPGDAGAGGGGGLEYDSELGIILDNARLPDRRMIDDLSPASRAEVHGRRHQGHGGSGGGTGGLGADITGHGSLPVYSSLAPSLASALDRRRAAPAVAPPPAHSDDESGFGDDDARPPRPSPRPAPGNVGTGSPALAARPLAQQPRPDSPNCTAKLVPDAPAQARYISMSDVPPERKLALLTIVLPTIAGIAIILVVGCYWWTTRPIRAAESAGSAGRAPLVGTATTDRTGAAARRQPTEPSIATLPRYSLVMQSILRRGSLASRHPTGDRLSTSAAAIDPTVSSSGTLPIPPLYKTLDSVDMAAAAAAAELTTTTPSPPPEATPHGSPSPAATARIHERTWSHLSDSEAPAYAAAAAPALTRTTSDPAPESAAATAATASPRRSWTVPRGLHAVPADSTLSVPLETVIEMDEADGTSTSTREVGAGAEDGSRMRTM